ncbi:Uncharacterized protein dnm_056650 [Desulfonema magnum]|uniref:Uncharacterized protein n=1 Tax=Desulfonema magnum TaxID=45655 RepID=A0A975GQ84_9BACT|nr:Uncharacterized protein dnm_056650 [Desulfonema magnum]
MERFQSAESVLKKSNFFRQSDFSPDKHHPKPIALFPNK